MKEPITILCVAVSVAAFAYTTSITDTTGYVVQTATDAAGTDSLINGAHFPGGAPTAGKDYLVNNEFNIRSPGTPGTYTFQGDSLTLDGGASLLLKGPGSKVTIADLRMYNARILQGDGSSEKTLKGGLTVYGTPSAPTLFMGSGNQGVRKLSIESTISGASGTRIKVMHTEEADLPGCQFYTFMKSDNSGYAGSFEVESADNGVCLVGFNNNTFGASPNILLKNNGKLFGGGNGTLGLSGATITLDNGGLFGVYSYSGSQIGLEIGNNSTITGTGTLTINNSGVEGNHLRRVALAKVSITGIDGIQVNSGLLQLTSNYNNPAIPIVVTQPVMLRTVLGCHAGPITLRNASYVNPGAENVTYASLTLEQTEDNPPYIAQALRQGLITIDGNLVNNLRAGGKIRIDFNDNDIANDTLVSHLAGSSSYRLLTAANLGTAGVTADDFTATADSATAFIRPYILGGAFSIETADSKTYLVYTPPKKFVYLNGKDASGNAANGSSFLTGGRWSDGKVPHADAAYFIPADKLLRAPDAQVGAFPDTSLAILDGGMFSAQQTTVTVNDLRLYGGCIVNATRNFGNRIVGNITVLDAADKPVYMTIEVAHSQSNDYRPLYVDSDVSGSGIVQMRYSPTADADHSPTDGRFGRFYVNGSNVGFTGEWQIAHWCVKTIFEDAAAVGGASSIHFKSNGVCWVQSSYALPASVGVNVDAAGSVAGDEGKTNGGTFEVDANKVITVAGVVSGGGILRKTGTGALRLDAENAISTAVVVKEGFIGGTGKVNAVELKDGAGLDVSAAQATPFEIGALTVDGGIALNIRVAAGVDIRRIAVAKVGTLTGTLGMVKATVDGVKGGSYRLSVDGGILYATKRGMSVTKR